MNLDSLIIQAGYIGLFLIVFAESGLFFGFFLPGDSLIFTSGFLASQGIFNIYLLLILLSAAAITGDSVGFWFGKRMGKRIFNKEDSLLFHKKNLVMASEFYEKHGGKTIILARFVPAVRTFAPIVAGAADMHYTKFVTYNVLGGLLWVLSMGFGGYFLGRTIPEVDKYMIPIVGLIVLISVSPGLYHFLKGKENRALLVKFTLKFFNNLGDEKKSPDDNTKY